jgi:ribosome biogenesis GTPase
MADPRVTRAADRRRCLMTTWPPSLAKLGWDDRFAQAFPPPGVQDVEPARVILEHQHIYRVATATDEPAAVVAGRLRHTAQQRSDYPAVGDWVAIARPAESDRVIIHAVLPRRSRFSRKVAGSETEAQVVAANIDVVFIVAGLDRDFNPRRIERYLVTAWEGGATPVVVLNKADLVADAEARVEAIHAIAPGVPVHAVSCKTGAALSALEPYLQPGRTVALLGSSGVGKSTIINRLSGFDRQRTREVRDRDSRGRHTTTNRELVVLPAGGLLIDTPGMRELQLWDVGESLHDTFDDIRQAAAGCHFRDCRHDTEPRCAVKNAVEAGVLPRERLQNFIRLQRELDQLAARQDERLTLESKRRDRLIHRAQRQHKPRS